MAELRKMAIEIDDMDLGIHVVVEIMQMPRSKKAEEEKPYIDMTDIALAVKSAVEGKMTEVAVERGRSNKSSKRAR